MDILKTMVTERKYGDAGRNFRFYIYSFSNTSPLKSLVGACLDTFIP